MKAQENPFRKERVEAFRYQIKPAEFEKLAEKFWQIGGRAAILGAKGTGKTTLMEDLRPLLTVKADAFFWVYLYEGMPKKERTALIQKICSAPTDTMLFIDGGETLSYWQWRKVRRCNAKLLVSVHKHCQLPVLYETRKSLDIALAMTEHLLGKAPNEKLRTQIEQIFATRQGNIREVMSDLYLLHTS